MWRSSRRGTRQSRRPAKRMRTPLPFRSSRWRVRIPSLKFMRYRTSSGGRRQFSVEKANMVSHRTPISSAPSTVSNIASSPAACPSVRGRPRARAQRPFPSMTQATWVGTRARSTPCDATAEQDSPAPRNRPPRPATPPRRRTLSAASRLPGTPALRAEDLGEPAGRAGLGAGLVALRQPRPDALLDEPPPVETLAGAAAGAHGAAHVADDAGEVADRLVEHLGDAGPDPAGEERARPLRRDGHGDGAAPRDGRDVERARAGVVGGVHEDAGALGVEEHAAVDLGVAGGRDDEAEPAARRLPGRVAAPGDRDVERLHGGAGLGGDDRHDGPALDEGGRLAG